MTADFALPNGKKQPTRFVADRRQAGYGKTEDAEVLALPFATARYECLCVLPALKKKETPAAALLRLEKKLNPALLKTWADAVKSQEVDIRLPKLDLKGASTDIIPLVKNLGVKTAFGNHADFSAMCQDGKDLKVGVFKQTAAFRLDEQGAEAAAATAVVVMTKSARRLAPPATFHADHPCLILIRDTETGTVPFIIRCAAPEKAPVDAGPEKSLEPTTSAKP